MLEVIIAVGSLLLLAGGIRGGAALARLLARTYRALPPGGGPAERPENVRRILKHLVRAPIAGLVDGTASVIHGRVSGEPTLVAPLTGTPCLGFHISIRAETITAELLHDHARCGDFTLTDLSGALAVRGAGLELAITREATHAFEPPFPPWLRQLIPPRTKWIGVTVSEGLLRSGDEALVCGVASVERGVDNYRDGETVMVTLVATPTFPLVASTDDDLMAPGVRPIDPAELPR